MKLTEQDINKVLRKRAFEQPMMNPMQQQKFLRRFIDNKVMPVAGVVGGAGMAAVGALANLAYNDRTKQIAI